MTTPAPAALGREERQACWTHRDLYFGCLTANNVNVPGQEKESGACAVEKKGYEGSCAASWVDYFNKRRVLQLRQDLMEKQAEAQRNAPGGPITGAKKQIPIGGRGKAA